VRSQFLRRPNPRSASHHPRSMPAAIAIPSCAESASRPSPAGAARSAAPWHVQNLKRRLHDRAPKTVNNVLTVLNVLLKKAVEWNVIDRVPCVIRLLPIPKPSAGLEMPGPAEAGRHVRGMDGGDILETADA
jgi:hypothetical protein